MDLNKVVADLEIEKTTIHSIETKCVMTKLSDSNKKTFGLDIKCSQPLVKENKKYGKLRMQIDMSIDQSELEGAADKFQFVIEGVFSSSPSIEDEKFMELLNINGGTALYSIARAKIEAISSLIYDEGKILLPMINIIQYYKEKFEEENKHSDG